MNSSYTVATDGACMRNPGPTGWAWVGQDGRWAAGSLVMGTNNIGELLAVLHAIRDHAHVADLLIQADSMYAINTYTTWMDAHARRGWKTAAKDPTKNADILRELMAARDDRRSAGLPDVRFEHVRGHAGHRLNGWADERAVRASQHGDRGLAAEWSTDRGQEPIEVGIGAQKAGEDRPSPRR